MNDSIHTDKFSGVWPIIGFIIGAITGGGVGLSHDLIIDPTGDIGIDLGILSAGTGGPLGGIGGNFGGVTGAGSKRLCGK